MVDQIYPPQLQVNKANGFDIQVPFFISFIQSYDKRDGCDFDIVHFPYSDGDVPLATSYRVKFLN